MILAVVATLCLLSIGTIGFGNDKAKAAKTQSQSRAQSPAPAVSSAPPKENLRTSHRDKCMVSFGTYNGKKYSSPSQTVGKGLCLVESKWMQVMQHTVKVDPENNDKVIDDWLFIDYHDRVNVLVQDPTSSNEDPSFLVFRQTKYALGGRESLAVIGGIIEPKEDSEAAASREVMEEMGLVCKFQHLGTFQTDVNRGMGSVHSYLAKDCRKEKEGEEDAMDAADEVGKPDTERQDVICMNLVDLRTSAMAGKFLEVQWSNTVSLALLHLGNASADNKDD